MSPHRILVVLFPLLALCACTKPVTPAGQGPASVTVAKPVPKQITEWDEFTGRLAAVESFAWQEGYFAFSIGESGVELQAPAGTFARDILA